MGSSSCELRVVINKPSSGEAFTNFDRLTGRVHLKVKAELTLSSIQVKLQGISKTAIEIPKERLNGGKSKLVFETHRLLYDTETVFPSQSQRLTASNVKDFTLLPGNYHYPFEFLIPLKSKCSKLTGISNKVQILHNSAKTGIELIGESEKHIELNLPPSLSGSGDGSTIKYFVKATLKRPGLLKSNIRCYEPFIFLPIDDSYMLTFDDRQIFTKRDFVIKDKYPEVVAHIPPPTSTQSQFPAQPQTPPSNIRRTSSSNSQTSLSSASSPVSSPYSKIKPRDLHVKPVDLKLSLEIRFRYPAYVIPTKPPNYKICILTELPPSTFELFNGESSGLGCIYIRYFQVELVTNSKTRVSSYKDQQSSKTTIYVNGRLNYKLDLASTKESHITNSKGEPLYEIEIPKKIYKDAILPDNIAPSFITCNIARSYKLLVNVGISDSSDSETVQMIPLETHIEVLSGVEPPIQDSQYLENSHNENDTFGISHTTDGARVMDSALPTYEEVIKENRYRRAFEQSDQYYINLED
ncbi:hypothetical protein CANARDRAFT_203079 [[Candida] arabinofermentans NRRL YB-2248]|uniref:Arrestin-like N-terminal domain-containing protein n=1 Tax=[Candida] arabinofermentans NRRL YB-2248 TaxID=983967 RepID=A0A1E4SVD5_9ASCO|nr:hypothetical protein CANARDRAFT_203079 [[Candida] arabinofermentans NRRL YB-2248]